MIYQQSVSREPNALAEWKREFGAVRARKRVIHHDKRKGHWYINCAPHGTTGRTGLRPKAEAHDWPGIVAGLKAATGWTYVRIDGEVGAGHGSSRGWALGEWRPMKGHVRAALIRVACEHGVTDAAGNLLRGKV